MADVLGIVFEGFHFVVSSENAHPDLLRMRIIVYSSSAKRRSASSTC